MAGAGDGMGRVAVEVALGEDGVARPRLVGAGDGFAAEDDLGVMDGGAAFGATEVVPAVFLVEVRALDPDGFGADIDAAVDEDGARADELSVGDVELLNPDGAMAVVERSVVGWVAVVEHPGAPVVVEEERGVDALEVEPHGVAPRAGGIGRGDEEIAAGAHHRAHNVKDAVVVFDGGGEEAARDGEAVVVELVGPVDDVAGLSPVHQIGAVKDQNAGEVGEAGVDEVVVVADAADARVGVVAGEDGVAVVAGG